MKCRVCDSTDLTLALDLGDQPWANNFLPPERAGTEPVYPLRLLYCQQCGTAQLDHTVPKEVMFADHTYLSGVTQSLRAHFAVVAADADTRFGAAFQNAGRSVLDIGSNDGTQLREFQKLGYDVLGVESSRAIARIANEAGVPTRHAFFNEETSAAIGRRFSIIHAAGVFFHLEELHSVTRGIRAALADDGVFIVQFLYMCSIMRNLAFDQIYHEHLLYYNLATLDTLLRRHGLYLFDARWEPIHGGSIIAFAGKQERPPSERLSKLRATEAREDCNSLAAYQRFAHSLVALRERERAWLAERKREGKRIFGLGAPVKGNTLLHYFDIGRETLDCLVERNPLRRGLVSPGKHIPIVIEDELTAPPDVYYVLAWNFRDEILKRYADLLAAGVEFHFPIEPTPVALA